MPNIWEASHLLPQVYHLRQTREIIFLNADKYNKGKAKKWEKKTREIIFLNSDKYNEWQGGEEGKENKRNNSSGLPQVFFLSSITICGNKRILSSSLIYILIFLSALSTTWKQLQRILSSSLIYFCQQQAQHEKNVPFTFRERFFLWIDSMLIYRIHQYGFCQQGTLIIKPMTKKEFFEIENVLVWSLQWTNLSLTHITPGTNVGNQKLLQYPCRKWNREKVFVKTVGDKECSSAFLA